MGYEYKDVYKDVFIDEHEQLDVFEDCKVFLNKMEELKPYIVEFDENSVIKPKVYSPNCAVGDNYWQTIIEIIYNKYIFFANDDIWKA